MSATEADAFRDAHPKCKEFEDIFLFIRGLDISHDVAADVAKTLMIEESRANRNSGQFQKKYSDEDFLALFPEKAGASTGGLAQEAAATLGMSNSMFYRLLREHSAKGTIRRTTSGLWRASK